MTETLSRRAREKQARKNEIIAAAERVFCRKGFEAAAMEEIAREAQFTKRTIYQYFQNKEDLFYAVRLKERKQLFTRMQSAIAGEGTGLQRIRRATAAFQGFYRESPGAFRLMNDAVSTSMSGERTQHQQELSRYGPYMFQEMARVIEAGITDGSIRGDIDPKMAAPVLAFILTGLFRMLAEAGESFTSLLGLNQDEFVAFALGLLGDALRA